MSETTFTLCTVNHGSTQPRFQGLSSYRPPGNEVGVDGVGSRRGNQVELSGPYVIKWSG